MDSPRWKRTGRGYVRSAVAAANARRLESRHARHAPQCSRCARESRDSDRPGTLGQRREPCYHRAPSDRPTVPARMARSRRPRSRVRPPAVDRAADDPPTDRPPAARQRPAAQAAHLRPGRPPGPRRTSSRAARSRSTRKLQEAGFKAFVVGGAVRDLLLGIEPKDFDIATDALPEQVKPLFRRAFLIGRRFRLVHVHVGPRDDRGLDVPRRADRRRRDRRARAAASDNVYGSQAEDAARRDFTINALYFDPATEEVWDYVGGVADIRARRLKLIGAADHALSRGPGAHAARGAPRRQARRRDRAEDRGADPEARAADAERAAGAAVRRDAEAAALRATRSRRCKSLRAHGLVARPAAAARRDPRAAARPALHRPRARQHRRARARRTAASRRASCSPRCSGTRCSRPGTPRRRAASKPIPALFDAMDRVLERQAKQIAIPRRFEATIKEIWSLQPRFEQRCRPAPVPAARASALPRRLGFPRPALQERRARRRARRVSPIGGTASPTPGPTSARRCCSRDEAPKRSAARAAAGASARRAARSRRRDAEPAPRVSATLAYVGLGSNLAHPRRQLARAVRALARLPRTRLVARRRRTTRARRSAAPRRSPTTSTRWPRSDDARPARAARGAARDRAPPAPAPRCRAQRNAPRTLDLDLLLYGRRRIARAAGSRCRTRACTSALSCCARSPRSRRARRFPGRGLARAIPAPRCATSASLAPARTSRADAPHSRVEPPMDLEKCRYIVVEGPIGAGKTSLARAARDAPRRRGAARAARGESLPRALLRGHGALRAADPAHVPVPARRPAARRRPARHVPARDGRRFPARQGSAVRAPQPLRCRVRALREGLRAPEAADAHARPRRSTCRRRSRR